MSNSSAARTNLTSNNVNVTNYKLGEGAFRECYQGIYVGGNRNKQVAACKRFKSQYARIENEFFAQDFQIADKTIDMAESWNEICTYGKEIMVSRGTVHTKGGRKYMVEPLIRDYDKFTSNSGWIGNTSDWKVRCMEAFTHYTYHKTGGQMIVCDIQGRYRHNRYSKAKSRLELGDPAICSRSRRYGPTDLGEKGIESFFANHCCNEFCESSWSRPRTPSQWFPLSKGTSMVSSLHSNRLALQSRATFRMGGNLLMEVVEEDEDDYSDSDDDSSDDDYSNDYSSDDDYSDDDYW
mmetsp:Transcript_18567/g.45988  ORF Transcript_18567/g.45988 Transcript_18567/m.45988 type:complete len:294 (+) Transcript_18567:211-1092(+)|eukprot:CAMPEP_0113645356 /NCGR_PEP_ID=MMETSP0017_2-20120614/23903_1 /TAXON_ID=2856 /ORGANISM="Cylindrotheca closterium" /LENGTH=293 /DNA_ID=CAMNT_0000557079 /DNA_START=134 /DNA_END=1012 /DNA_ORIENTATION=+ /assembly_acc=CAM_ASM_000147